ncbi:hypothetical protein E2C01_068443 [Portunus trituberculatus]|uniref:Uncharacterized protein n=1 Tax=Portunus trituberculatus TaxID=210409 RepID=A0A5B7HXW7_PORTR|nr:hypothetical protein [Portunus trituberculatus]
MALVGRSEGETAWHFYCRFYLADTTARETFLPLTPMTNCYITVWLTECGNKTTANRQVSSDISSQATAKQEEARLVNTFPVFSKPTLKY